MPARLVVAGLATDRSCTSKSRLIVSFMPMRSPLMSVSVLLSSMTVFMLSIQSVSTGPSSSSHFSSGLSSRAKPRNTDERMPSAHSIVCRS